MISNIQVTDNNTLKMTLNGEIQHNNIKMYQEVAYAEIQQKHPKKLVLDFANVTYIDSAAIGFLLSCYKNVKACNGEIVITKAKSVFKKILRLSGVDRIVTIT